LRSWRSHRTKEESVCRAHCGRIVNDRNQDTRRMTVDNEDTERKDRAPDIAGEERQTLARHRLAVRLGIDPRLAEYLLELRERIEKLEDRQGSS
jgi:hypothetical protein